MPNLRELYLQDNLLATIANITFAALPQLEVLFLQGNRLTHFPVWAALTAHPYLVSLRLGGNLWSCDCAHRRQFSRWLELVADKVADYDQLECRLSSPLASSVENDDTSETRKIIAGDSGACDEEEAAMPPRGGELFDPASGGDIIADNGRSIFNNELLVPFIAAAIALLTLVVLLLVVFLCRHEVRLCLSLNYGVRFFKRVDNNTGSSGGDDEEKLYDAFVIYSKGDEMFVRDVLAAELELSGSRHRLCLYHRDLNATASHYVTDVIVQAVETSRRTILVLSENLLQQGWRSFSRILFFFKCF
jgi:Leucine rich repeat/TIR domain